MQAGRHLYNVSVLTCIVDAEEIGHESQPYDA